jgi:hypothetical protein
MSSTVWWWCPTGDVTIIPSELHPDAPTGIMGNPCFMPAY